MSKNELIVPYLQEWGEKYRKDLVDNILPFWLKHGLDRVNGGVYTCVDREGRLMDTTKSVWFQGRCAFTYSFAYNNVEKRPEYLEMAKSCLDFIEAHCFDPEDGRMYFEVTADGTPLRKRRYVFSECFAAIAMSEYSLATGDKEYARKALALFKEIQRFIATPGILQPKYEPSLQAIGHSVTMILINTASRIREAIADPCLDEQIEKSIDAIRRYFLHPEYKALLEMVTPDGKLIDTIAGRTINPGHCIETAWFLLEESCYRGWDKELTDMALQILDWSWEWGWDEEFGGIINFKDCKGFPAQDYSQDMKFWWPQTEAVIATLYAYLATGDNRYMEMHRLANDWAYEYLPDPVYGEWFGYLHRDGSVAQPAKGNLFKGPFHIPRMMIKSSMLINEILKK
ncbi:MAG: N-acylglucosamine 2-epimerase [Bacteroides sp.]|nr:N-acylglucosamine 2-epimerase [Bacteroidales bacterium]MBD5242536.1 N-acylglucosamine 2-epimerase [Barnesiella sp.]MBD5315703.1 N-acylglucosamine 2-epimerase [Bacteroides sp.]MDE7449939.1 AGE family epimerase/isomerase [Paramuribaculum sp.]